MHEILLVSYWFLLVQLVSIGPVGFYVLLVSIGFNWFQLALLDFNGISIGPIGPIDFKRFSIGFNWAN